MFERPIVRLQEPGLDCLTRNTEQEGVATVLLPRPARHIRAPMCPCAEAPLSGSTVLSAVAGA